MGFSIYSSILLAGLFASQTLIASIVSNRHRATRPSRPSAARSSPYAGPPRAHGDRRPGNVDNFGGGSAPRCCCIGIIVPLPAGALVLQTVQRQCIAVSSCWRWSSWRLAQLAGLEPIIGAFSVGLNRLMPAPRPLMVRIEFVGNAIFILLLMGVGIIDYRAFFATGRASKWR